MQQSLELQTLAPQKSHSTLIEENLISQIIDLQKKAKFLSTAFSGDDVTNKNQLAIVLTSVNIYEAGLPHSGLTSSKKAIEKANEHLQEILKLYQQLAELSSKKDISSRYIYDIGQKLKSKKQQWEEFTDLEADRDNTTLIRPRKDDNILLNKEFSNEMQTVIAQIDLINKIACALMQAREDKIRGASPLADKPVPAVTTQFVKVAEVKIPSTKVIEQMKKDQGNELPPEQCCVIS